MRNMKAILPGLIVAGLVGLLLLQHTEALNAETPGIFPELQKFTDCLDLIDKYYVEEVTPGKLIEGAIKGMTSTLDPHSTYLSKEDYKEMQISTTGSFGGLGIELGLRDSQLTVITPIEGTPERTPERTLAELVALSKTQPLNFAVTALGSAPHLAGVAVERATGAKWQYIPYKGGSQAIADTVGGQAQVLMNGMLATLPHVQSGKLKLIGVSKRTRMPLIGARPLIHHQRLAPRRDRAGQRSLGIVPASR